MQKYILSTERLNLRKMTRKDAENLMVIFADTVAMKHYPSTKNENETKKWIDWTLNNYTNYGVGLWIVEDKKTGDFLGQCGIVPQEVDGEIEMEIGYLFARHVWGNGYATEAALACKEYGFKKLKKEKMISLIDSANINSIKVAERIGMKMEKVIHKWEKEVLVYSVFV